MGGGGLVGRGVKNHSVVSVFLKISKCSSVENLYLPLPTPRIGLFIHLCALAAVAQC